jgi:hypothetical protein
VNPKDAKARRANPHCIFLIAEAFDKACQALTDTIPEQDGFTRSTVIPPNAALTLELYLKCLSVLEHGSYVEGHDLGQLFRLLGRETKQALEKKWKKAVAETECFQDLEECLSLGKDSFVKFRYAFEPASAGTVWALGKLIPIVKSLILHNRPQWKTQ